MKKLLLVFTFVLVGAFSFANNQSTNTLHEVSSYFGTCTYSITTTVTFSDGSSYSYTDTYTTEASSLSDCMRKAKNHVAFLNAQ